MTKFRKFIPVLVCSFLIAGGSVAAIQGLNKTLARQVQATTDCGPVVFSGIDYSMAGGGDGGSIYLTALENDVTFSEWDYKIFPVDNQGGIFVGDRDLGRVQMVKFSATQYYVNLQTTLTEADAGKVVTITGEWVYSDGENNHTFAVSPEFKLRWGGANWGNCFDLEDYETVSLLDCGIADSSGTAIDTEQGYGIDNLYHNAFALNNETGSYALQFRIEALDDVDMTGQFSIRVGSNSSWDLGHLIQVNLNNFWGAHGWGNIAEVKDNVILQESGEIPVDLDAGASHIFEMGVVKIKNSSNFNVFGKYDNGYIYNDSWTLDASERTTRVGLYYGGTNLAISNTIQEPVGTVGLTPGVPNSNLGIHFHCTEDLAPGLVSWQDYGLPYSNDAIKLNGTSMVAGKINYFKKVGGAGNNVYYLSFSDAGVTPVKGDKLFIGGTFKFVQTVIVGEGDDAVRVPQKLRKLSIKFSAFVFDGTDWLIYDLPLLTDSAETELEAGNLLLNIGKWNPDHSKQCVKEFDQDSDSLVYKKDRNGHTGVYFTNSNETTHGEFRVYLPDNGYKSETKGYAMTQFSFDYILEDAGAPTETGRNHSLTPDGYYVPSAGPATNKFTLQVMCHNTTGLGMYFDYDIELINDGALHTLTFNLAYSDVFGFCFVLWNFNGTFFMSNCHANYLEYNQALNELVYDALKMYDYANESGSCTSYYAGAKAAYEALTDTEKGIFNTEAAYGSARARLAAWALANGEVFDPISGTFTANTHGINATALDKNNVVVISIVIFAIALISVAGVMLVIKKRKHSK